MKFHNLLHLLENPFTGEDVVLAPGEALEKMDAARNETKIWKEYSFGGNDYRVSVQQMNRYLWRYVLFDGDESVAVLDIDREGFIMDRRYVAQIQFAYQVPNAKYRGVLRNFMKDFILPQVQMLASDRLQTIEGSNMWQRIYAQNPKKIWAYNIEERSMGRINSRAQLQKIIAKNDYDIVFIWKN